MRILLLNDYGVVVGGAEHATLALRDGLRARGHEVRIFASTALRGRHQSFADFHCYGTTSRIQPLAMAANPSAFVRLRETLASFQPDIVHCEMVAWQLSPLVLPLLRSFPVVHHIQMYNPICPLGSKLLKAGTVCHEPAGAACLRNGCFSPYAWAAVMLQRALWRCWSGAVDRMIAVSECVKHRLLAEGAPVHDVIGNGLPKRPRATMSDAPVVSFAGRLVPEKGADLLIEAFAQVRAQVPGAVLLIAGDGPERPRLEQLADRLALRESVRFLGFLERSRMDEQIGGAWVHAVPGRWEEPFGLVTAEAMMRGTPVVATAIGGTTELVEHGFTGILVEPGDVGALAAALVSLLRDRERAHALGGKRAPPCAVPLRRGRYR
jgi:glycosyltransferase involved in cell wall biosynthesis